MNDINVFGESEAIDALIQKIEVASEGDDEGFTFRAFVAPDEKVLHGSSGYGQFVRNAGVWERTPLTQEKAEALGVEFYDGQYGTDSDGVIYSKPEMQELGLKDWYNWNIDNWGTKWDAYEVDIDRVDSNNLRIHMETAWAPPTPVIHAMQEQHPELTISMEYDEEGMMFRGVVHPDGSVASEEYWSDEEEDLDV